MSKETLKVGDIALHVPTGDIVVITKVGAVTYDIIRADKEGDLGSIVPYEDIRPLSRSSREGPHPMPKVIPNLKFCELREASHKRAVEAFGHEAGLTDWSPAEWSNALAGEVGELCNLTKKLQRDGNIPLEEIGKEIADVVIYADLIATRMGFKLEKLVRQKFNEVSDRKGSDIKL